MYASFLSRFGRFSRHVQYISLLKCCTCCTIGYHCCLALFNGLFHTYTTFLTKMCCLMKYLIMLTINLRGWDIRYHIDKYGYIDKYSTQWLLFWYLLGLHFDNGSENAAYSFIYYLSDNIQFWASPLVIFKINLLE